MTVDHHQDHLLGSTDGLFRVADWVVNVSALEITRGNSTRKLEPKVMDLLVCLAKKEGDVVPREELEESIWGGVVVGYDSLTMAVTKLRKAFDDSARHPKVIETVPKAGYRLIAEVKRWRQKDDSASQAAATQDMGSVEPLGLPSTSFFGTRLHLLVAFVGVFSFLGVLFWWQPWVSYTAPARSEKMALPLPHKPSIAVLAFQNRGGESEQEYLSDAIADNVITELSRFSELFVIAQNSSFAYKGKSVDVRRIAEELGVQYVLEGSLQRVGDSLRVTTQLIDALTGQHMWAERYDRGVRDLFAIQDDITSRVAATVAHTIAIGEKEKARSERTHPANFTAYEYWLRGHEIWWRFSEQANEQARGLFEKAVELDPGYYKGYFGLALVYLNRYRWNYGNHPRDESRARMLQYAEKVMQFAPGHYDSHHLMGYVLLRMGQVDKAFAQLDEARKLNPNSDHVLMDIAEGLNYVGRFQEAIAHIDVAMRLNPHHPDWYYWTLADAQYDSGKYEEALASMNKISPITNHMRRSLAQILVRLGRVDEARAVMNEYLKNEPEFTLARYRQYIHTLPIDESVVDIEPYIDDLRIAGVPE